MKTLLTLTVLACFLIVKTNGRQNGTMVRLQGGHSAGTGRLEILVNNVWRSIYGSGNFGDGAAKVACRMLGFGHSGIAYTFGNAYGITLFGQGTGNVIYESFRCTGDESDLRACVSSSWYISTYGHSYDVCISCEPTPLRLVDGDSQYSGRVELFMKGKWTTVCDASGFSQNDAKTICNILGFSNTGIAKAFNRQDYGTAVGSAIYTSPACLGTETDIKQCGGSWGNVNCDHNYDVGVSCGSTEIRLVNGPNNSSGRVEVKHGGQWGTVCGYNGFSTADAKVICRMQGFSTQHAISYATAYYGEGVGPVAILQLNCDGSEIDIANCKSSYWHHLYDPNSYCKHTYDAGVNCAGETIIRLADGPTDQSGRLEIFHDGFWGTVSSLGFDSHDLAVVCKMLGFKYTKRSFFRPNSFYGEGIGEVVVKNLQCSGAESDIGICKADWWPNTANVNHKSDVGVSCDGVITVRIVNGSDNASGRVEILHNGNYGTVCGQNFDRLDLIVVCKLLGFQHASRSAYWYPAPNYDQGIGEIVVSDLQCSGIESSLGQCHGTWPASSYCNHAQDVYVNCNGSSEQLRLVDGHNQYSGRVEIFHGGQWATICDTGFDKADAVVICRILGFAQPEMAVAHTRAYFGQANSSVPMALGSLQCNGLELTLGQCKPTWNIELYQPYQCGHSQDIGVDCCGDCQHIIVG